MRDRLARFLYMMAGRELDIHIRIFNLLASIGILASAGVGVTSLFTDGPPAAMACFALCALAVGLLFYATKTGNYLPCYYITVIGIFLVGFTIVFFVGGGYLSGMPLFFVFAVVFTAFLLEGRALAVMLAVEAAVYGADVLIAWNFPQLVLWHKSTVEMAVDILVCTLLVSVSVGAAVALQVSLYREQHTALEVKNEQLTRYNEAKSTFLTTVAHEMKGPLNLISLSAQDTLDLLNEPEQDKALIEENMHNIVRTVKHLDHTVLDLIDNVAIERGQLSLNPIPASLCETVRIACESFFRKSYTAGNRLSLMLDTDLPPLNIDADRITQVMTNLLNNAIRHTKDGEITVTLRAAPDGQLVTVQDNGEGISADILGRVFSGYVSVSKYYWRHGIGLYVCHQIVTGHGGKIWIDSEVGKGTTVSFLLPEKEGLA